MDRPDDLIEILDPLLKGLGLSLVDASIGKRRGETQVHLVLHKEGGVSLDDLTGAQRVVRPRLEMAYDRDQLTVEISSPGATRVFKGDREYGIFIGRRVLLLVGDAWRAGILKGFDGQTVELGVDDGIEEIPVDSIRKGKLDF